MTARETILGLIEAGMFRPKPITGESHLHKDLGFDSLSFTALLVSIEDAFTITFTLEEMQRCVQVEALISLVEAKLQQGGLGHA